MTRASTAIGIGCVLFVVTAEIAVRSAHPTPPIQIVRADTPGLRLVDGQPLWRVGDAYASLLENLACPGADTVDIVFAGDSILYVTDAVSVGGHPVDDGQDNVSLRLQRSWADRAPRRCAVNVSQPGFHPAQQARRVWEVHDEIGADLVVFGVWKDDSPFVQVGPDWYELSRFSLGAGGVPRPLGLPLPAPVERWLFTYSAAWQLGALTLGASAPPLESPPESACVRFLDQALAVGIRVVLVEFPPLNRPFAQSVADRPPRSLALQAEARRRAVPYVVVAEDLQGTAVQDIRLDTCCHYNPEGHARLAEVLGPVIDAVIDGR